MLIDNILLTTVKPTVQQTKINKNKQKETNINNNKQKLKKKQKTNKTQNISKQKVSHLKPISAIPRKSFGETRHPSTKHRFNRGKNANARTVRPPPFSHATKQSARLSDDADAPPVLLKKEFSLDQLPNI